MNADEIVRALRCVQEKHRNDRLLTFQTDVSAMARDAADMIESLQAELAEYDTLAAEYGIDGKTMLTLAKSQIKTAQDNVELMEQLEESQRRADAAVELAGKLVALCHPPREWHDRLFCRHVNRPGVYMGSGYDFLDGFYRLFDDFAETADEETYRAVQSVAEREFEKRHGPKGSWGGRTG